MDVCNHNRAAWDRNVETQNPWTQPVGREIVERARQGQFELFLTPTKPVPLDWFPELSGTPTLCLASGGGQQGPLLAAAGALVTVFDNSPKQLGQDCLVAEREGLSIDTVEGDMADLSAFSDATFDLVVLLPGRGFYIWGGYANYPPYLKKHGLYFSQAIIWDKQHPVLTRKDFMGAHEWCFYGWREVRAKQRYGPLACEEGQPTVDDPFDREERRTCHTRDAVLIATW